MHDLDRTATQLIAALVGISIIKILPYGLKKIRLATQLGENGVQYIQILLLTYIIAAFVIPPVAQVISELASDVVFWISNTFFRWT